MFRFYDESLFEQALAKRLDKATNNYSMTAGFKVDSLDSKIKLRVHLDRYRNREYKETPLLDKFEEICAIVDPDTFKACMLIIYDVLMRKEQERKAPELTHTS